MLRNRTFSRQTYDTILCGMFMAITIHYSSIITPIVSSFFIIIMITNHVTRLNANLIRCAFAICRHSSSSFPQSSSFALAQIYLRDGASGEQRATWKRRRFATATTHPTGSTTTQSWVSKVRCFGKVKSVRGRLCRLNEQPARHTTWITSRGTTIVGLDQQVCDRLVAAGWVASPRYTDICFSCSFLKIYFVVFIFII